MSQRLLTANRLTDGAVVYLHADGGWTERVDDARVAAGPAEADALVETGGQERNARQIVDPYLVDLTDANERARPHRLRERIRAVGPTVRPDLARYSEARP